VLGPYVAIEHRLAIDRGSFSLDDTSETVIDLRSAKQADIKRIKVDPAASEATGAPSVSGRRWHNDEYDIITRSDSAREGQAVVLRDHRGREWRLGLVKSPLMQVFWLDKPKIDASLRQALMRAFNAATNYGEPVQLASRQHPTATRRRVLQIPIT
jgi:hypothetical protein